MTFDLEDAVRKATEEWKMRHSAACPGGIKDGIYTQEFKYHWGSNWMAMENDGRVDARKGYGRTEQEAIDDLKEQL